LPDAVSVVPLPEQQTEFPARHHDWATSGASGGLGQVDETLADHLAMAARAFRDQDHASADHQDEWGHFAGKSVDRESVKKAEAEQADAVLQGRVGAAAASG
jgi:hypothetical protein